MIPERHHPTHWYRAAVTTVLVISAAWALRPRRVMVTGRSMWPAFEPGDRLLVIPAGPIRVGDVVALRDPRNRSRLLIKRIRGRRGARVDVRGDNPAESTDSRHFGLVWRWAVTGRVVYRYRPPSRAGWWPQ